MVEYLFSLATVVKKIFSIALLICLALTISGYYLIFFFQRQHVRAEMKEILQKKKWEGLVSVISFSSAEEINWEGENEFEDDGQMYDVIEKVESGGKIIIRCISDEKETALVKKLAGTIGHDSQSGKITGNLFHLLQNLFFSSFQNTIAFFPAGLDKSVSPFQKLPFQLREIITPPPQSAQIV